MNRTGRQPPPAATPASLRLLATLLLSVGLIVVLPACSSFNRQWREAGQPAQPTNSLTGRWEGRWISNENGHNGALRCIISESAPGTCEARFRATYMKVARFSYKVPLRVTVTNGIWYFMGEENLGTMAGGIYRYAGSASASNFNATYASKYDRGVFQMSRPE